MNRVDRARLEAVLDAARTLLKAREAQMLTADEWDGIEHKGAPEGAGRHDRRDWSDMCDRTGVSDGCRWNPLD